MNLIAAADLNWGIGCKGSLQWNIPEDMEFFKSKTKGKTVVMGRKTFDSLRIKPLPGRRNIIFTENRNFTYSGTETVHSAEELFSLTEGTPAEDIFVIGGAQIYRLLSDFCDTAFITRIYSSKPADSYILNFENTPEWKTADMSELKEFNGTKYRFVTYKKASLQ